jgi:hypothetical protein
VPIAEGARRFLRPLVGFDPGQVPVHRGPEAERAATAHGAEAMSVDGEIVLGSAASDREPDTLAILAHELTHVARRRAPRFVPPVIRGAPLPPGASADEEEALARTVESRVRALAVKKVEAATSAMVAQPVGATAAVGAEPAQPIAPGTPAAEEDGSPMPPQRRADQTGRSLWGDLPAPWEPLPEFLGAGVGWSQPRGEFAGGFPGPSVQRASLDRQEVTQDPVSRPDGGETARPAEGGQPAPNIDALARQVYAVLRRRLAAERRREG